MNPDRVETDHFGPGARDRGGGSIDPTIDIAGGADAEVAAALAAVVSHLLAEEAAIRATPVRSPEQSSWVQAGRMRPSPPLANPGGDAPDWSQFTVSDGS